MKKISLLLALMLLMSLVSAMVVYADEPEITFVADSGEVLTFEAVSEDLFEGWGSFDTKESLDHFTTGGYLVVGDTKTKLSEASAYWRHNASGYLEVLGDGGSTTKASMLTFVPLNGGEEIGEEKMYYFSMRVYTPSAKEVKIAWNATKSEQFWSINSGTEYGGRYPDYGSASTTLDNDEAIDNNALIYAPGGWHTVDGYMVANSEAKYFMLNCRYMQGSTSNPTRIDDIVLYEVKCKNAASEIFVKDYVVYDELPEIDGMWTDEAGYIVNGVYTRPEVGGVDTITANYTDGTKERFTVEVVGKRVQDSTGGNYRVLGENLLENASFEYYKCDNRSDGDMYPFIYTWESTITGSTDAGINNAENGCFEISNERFVTGKASMRVRYSDDYDNHSSFNQMATLDEGLYYLSYYARRTTSDKRDLEIRINGECVYSFNSEIILPDWNKYSAVFVAKTGDLFEFTGYNVSSVYVDAFLLVPVQKMDANCTAIIQDESGNTILEKTVENLASGARFVYDYSVIEEAGSELYVYKEGNNIINKLEKENTLTLTYEKILSVKNTEIDLTTPHHKAPKLPEAVKIMINDREYKVKVVWDAVDEKLYEKEGKTFTVFGVAGDYILVSANIEVVKNYNYITGRLSTADFTTIRKPETDSDKVEIVFDILPLYANIDAMVGFAASNTAVDSWNSCAVAVRLYTDGRFQYYSGSEGYVKSNVFYRSDTAYTVRMFVDLKNKTYSAYVSQKGSEYSLPICEDAKFREGAPDMTNVGQMLTRGGSGAPEGEFIVGNAQWGNVAPVSFLCAYKGDDGLKHIELMANESGTSKLYYTDYTDGLFGEMHTEEISYTKGEKIILKLENADNRKLMMIDDNLIPEFNAVELEESGDKSFVSSFMGSFAYYSNDYNSSITDDDPGIVQVNILEMYSDRFVITTRNYGEYTGAEENPAPSVFERYNGDDSQIDTPIMRVLLFGDYQIGDYLLSDEENSPLRPVFVKMCDELQNEHFDAVMIGGDLTYSDYVTKERWEYVVDSVLGMLKEKISPNIYIIAGNHDYNAGERDNYNSADYYNAYMKENLGSLEENGNGYFEQSEYYEGDVLVAFVYEQDGVYFMGLSTSPDMMRGSLQNTNYNYTEGAMDWIEEKLREIGPEKTVLFTAHFPLGDSNNLIRSSKGAAEDSTVRLLDILKDYPNLIYLYGHDHGSSFAYIDSKTEERVTRYDTDGYKID